MADKTYGDWIRSNPPLPTKEYKHMAQQTAIEDLIIALQKFKKSRMVCQVTIDAAIEFAAKFLEMEKEQIVDAYKADRYPCSYDDAEEYYNETYKTQAQ